VHRDVKPENILLHDGQAGRMYFTMADLQSDVWVMEAAQH
jgi:serine/threonine protein kinase